MYGRLIHCLAAENSLVPGLVQDNDTAAVDPALPQWVIHYEGELLSVAFYY
jgi:hypothetical protein